MRVGVALRGACRAWPSGCGRCRRVRRPACGAILQPSVRFIRAFRSARRTSISLFVEDRNPGRVVAAVLEPTQSIHRGHPSRVPFAVRCIRRFHTWLNSLRVFLEPELPARPTRARLAACDDVTHPSTLRWRARSTASAFGSELPGRDRRSSGDRSCRVRPIVTGAIEVHVAAHDVRARADSWFGYFVDCQL